MRVDIPLTQLQRKKLRLLAQNEPDGIGGPQLAGQALYQYLAKHKIRECGARRCDTEFIYRLASPGRPKIYCSNACRVAQQYHVKKGGDYLGLVAQSKTTTQKENYRGKH